MATASETAIPEAVVAIDFGTTYTGYAYSFKSEFQKSNDAREIFHNSWNSSLAGNLSKKAPTVALFKADYKFDSFGYEAEEKYSDLTDRKIHQEWHYFSRFKMQLFDKKNLTRNLEVKDQQGKTFHACAVFSESIRFIKTAALKEIKERNPVAEEDIHWVLTVPAIWNEPAKQFMREAAVEAGIPANQLILALEPEAAAIYCRTLKRGTFSCVSEQNVKEFLSAGGRYMILDMGGGTVDIAVHEVSDDGRLIEIIPASGGDWGGTNVDQSFLDFIETKIGKEDAERLKQTKTSHWIKLEKNFEVKKRTLKTSTENDIRVEIPPVLIMESKLDIKLFTSYKMDISNKDFKAFFNSKDNVIHHVKDILGQVEGVNLILMVGGYSQSGYVSNQIKEAFPDLVVLIPPQAEVAVMEGAVMFGFDPWTVSARMCRHTYGFRVNKYFIQGEHDQQHRINVNNQDLCANIFSRVVSKGEILKINDKRTENNLLSQHWMEDRKLMEMTIPIFASTDDNPKYTTDPSCQQIGIIRIQPPADGWPSSVKYCLEIYFGRTEFEVRVFNHADRTEYSSTFDLLVEKEIPHVPQRSSGAGVKTTSRCVIS